MSEKENPSNTFTLEITFCITYVASKTLMSIDSKTVLSVRNWSKSSLNCADVIPPPSGIITTCADKTPYSLPFTLTWDTPPKSSANASPSSSVINLSFNSSGPNLFAVSVSSTSAPPVIEDGLDTPIKFESVPA